MIFHSYVSIPEGTPLKHMSSSVGMMTFPIDGKIKHVPNHQPGTVFFSSPWHILSHVYAAMAPFVYALHGPEMLDTSNEGLHWLVV